MNDNKSFYLVIERHGGIGDQFFHTPVLHYFRLHANKIEGIEDRKLNIILSTQPRNYFIFENLLINGKPLINSKIDLFPLGYPRIKEIEINGNKEFKEVISLPHKDIDDPEFIRQAKENIQKLGFKPDAILQFFEAVERNNNADFVNVYDHHLQWAGIDPTTLTPEEKRPLYSVREREAKEAEKILKHCPGSNRLRIGVQMHSSSLPRTWDKFDKLLLSLSAKYPHAAIYSLGDNVAQLLELSPGERPRNYLPLAGKTSGDGRLWGACIASLDLLITVDSGALHLAGAMGVPVVGIFSTVPGWTRIKYYKNSIAVDSKYHCSPCHFIGLQCNLSVPVQGQNYIPSLSIAGKNSAYPCLASITVDEVMDAVEKLI